MTDIYPTGTLSRLLHHVEAQEPLLSTFLSELTQTPPANALRTFTEMMFSFEQKAASQQYSVESLVSFMHNFEVFHHSLLCRNTQILRALTCAPENGAALAPATNQFLQSAKPSIDCIRVVFAAIRDIASGNGFDATTSSIRDILTQISAPAPSLTCIEIVNHEEILARIAFHESVAAEAVLIQLLFREIYGIADELRPHRKPSRVRWLDHQEAVTRSTSPSVEPEAAECR